MNVSRQYELNRSNVRNICQSIYCNSLPMALVSSLIQNEVCVYEKQPVRSWLLDHLREMLKSVYFLPLTSNGRYIITTSEDGIIIKCDALTHRLV